VKSFIERTPVAVVTSIAQLVANHARVHPQTVKNLSTVCLRERLWLVECVHFSLSASSAMCKRNRCSEIVSTRRLGCKSCYLFSCGRRCKNSSEGEMRVSIEFLNTNRAAFFIVQQNANEAAVEKLNSSCR